MMYRLVCLLVLASQLAVAVQRQGGDGAISLAKEVTGEPNSPGTTLSTASRMSLIADRSDAEHQPPQAAGRPGMRLLMLGKPIGEPRIAAFSPDGKLLAIGSRKGVVALCDVAAGQLSTVLGKEDGYIFRLQFSPDGKSLATGGPDKSVHLWDVSKGTLRAKLGGHKEFVEALGFSPDGKVLVTCGFGNKRTLLWNVDTGQPVGSIPDGPEPVYPQKTGVLGTILGTMTKLPDHDFEEYEILTNAAFSPDGSLLAITTSSAVYFYSPSSKLLLRRLGEHESTIYTSLFSPDGRLIATASRDGTAKLWEVATGRWVATLAGHKNRVTKLAFSPDGHSLVTASTDRTAKIWDVPSGQLKATLVGGYDDLLEIAFSPDGRSVITASTKPSAKLWEAATGRLLATFDGGRGPVAFSPDGRTVVTGSKGDHLILWDISTVN